MKGVEYALRDDDASWPCTPPNETGGSATPHGSLQRMELGRGEGLSVATPGMGPPQLQGCTSKEPQGVNSRISGGLWTPSLCGTRVGHDNGEGEDLTPAAKESPGDPKTLVLPNSYPLHPTQLLFGCLGTREARDKVEGPRRSLPACTEL